MFENEINSTSRMMALSQNKIILKFLQIHSACSLSLGGCEQNKIKKVIKKISLIKTYINILPDNCLD